MKLNSSYIYLQDLRFHAYHGVEAQERIVGNDYLMDVRLQYPVDQAMLSDNVLDTVNYADVYRVLEQEMQVPSNLLERVAYRIADRIFRRFAFVKSIDSSTRLWVPIWVVPVWNSTLTMTMLSAGSRASVAGMARAVMGHGAPTPSVISTLM